MTPEFTLDIAEARGAFLFVPFISRIESIPQTPAMPGLRRRLHLLN